MESREPGGWRERADAPNFPPFSRSPRWYVAQKVANHTVKADECVEQYGRRPIFVLSLAVFVLFQIGCALAQNIWTLIICRFFAALFASSPLVVAGGVVADVFDPVRRGDA